MSEAPVLNGQVIGQTERATRALLDVLLAETDTPFDTWVSLKFVGDNGDVSADALVQQLAVGRVLTASDAEAIVADVRAAGFLIGTDVITLTDTGRARYDRISAGVDRIAGYLYADLPEADLVVARRVLDTLTERARAELAGPR
jgi:hypothetical protein